MSRGKNPKLSLNIGKLFKRMRTLTLGKFQDQIFNRKSIKNISHYVTSARVCYTF
jgi:hypothetical protein